MDGRTDQRTLAERLKGKFEQRGEDDCWPWRAAKDRRGYGRITVDRQSKLATHVILEADNRPRPPAPANHALHKLECSAGCSNPRHLRWGTHGDNMRDRMLEGTSSHKPGTFIGVKSNLTEKDIRDIRNSELTLEELGELYEISTRSIWDIKKRKSWQWVQD